MGGRHSGSGRGADHPFLPDTSSYDYDAPISEAGATTGKILEISGRSSPPISRRARRSRAPAAHPVVEIGPFRLGEAAPILDSLPAGVADERPRPIEADGQGRGCTLYRTTLPAGPAGLLRAKAVHDYAWIFVDGRPLGAMDRRSGRYAVDLPARAAPARLDILVEEVGRVNFGTEIADHKGLIAPVDLLPGGGEGSGAELTGWTVSPLPLDAAELAGLRYRAPTAGAGPAFWRGAFTLANPGDTYLDLRTWGKGVVWVNGRCLGRFWNIGPTQTMYCPGPWLRAGRNEVVVLDLLGPAEPVLAGLARPILDELHPEKDFVPAPGRPN